jgi:aryl-alcohol dehydrogenase-like predicted oxidoreductase
MERVELGGTGIGITPIGLGCWQFSRGNGYIGRWWDALSEETIGEIVAVSLAAGVNWFDTAEVYGWGRSEEALAQALRRNGVEPGDVVVATKWFPLLRRAGSIARTIDGRLAALGGYPVDLHQVHAPVSFSRVETEMRTLAALVRERKIRAVGVSNYSAGQMRRAHAALREEGLVLAANQVKYSLVERRIERNGVMEAARELGVTIIAYSPLGQGILSGKYHRDPDSIRARPGPRKRLGEFKRRGLAKTRPLVEELQRIAERHGATSSQVALNWLVRFHGDRVVAIPGAVRVEQARENAAALGFVLDDEEVTRLDRLSRGVTGL